MAKARRRPLERRSADRPRTGDSRACPRCRIGTIEFNERYRLMLTGARKSVPAWLCDRPACGYRELVRNTRPVIASASVRGQSGRIQAETARTMMKSRTPPARAGKTLAMDHALLRRRKES